MFIRRAEESDIDRINTLLHQVLDVHASGRPDIFIKGTKKYSDGELLEIIKNDATPIFVAENDGGCVVGYAFCVFRITQGNSILRDRRELYVDDLCVDEACRGQHIGSALYEYVADFARNNDFDAITLNVWSLNESAMKFYEKCGFEPLKVVMEKKINEK